MQIIFTPFTFAKPNHRNIMYIDLNALVKRFGLNEIELGRELFPNSAHPATAIRRIKNYRQELTSSQIVTLSEKFDIPIAELFNSEWLTVNANGGTIYTKAGVSIYEYPTFRDAIVTYRDTILRVDKNSDANDVFKAVLAEYKKHHK